MTESRFQNLYRVRFYWLTLYNIVQGALVHHATAPNKSSYDYDDDYYY